MEDIVCTLKKIRMEINFMSRYQRIKRAKKLLDELIDYFENPKPLRPRKPGCIDCTEKSGCTMNCGPTLGLVKK